MNSRLHKSSKVIVKPKSLILNLLVLHELSSLLTVSNGEEVNKLH